MGPHVNKNYPLVSVAIITYNQKQYLIECLESCLAQDYPNFEIVVADDGSTDGTHELLNDYALCYPGRFVLRLSEKNQGITKNSNAAHFACSGDYVAWIGGDDVMLPGKISKQVEYMERHSECTICYHDLDVFDDDTGRTLYFYSDKNKPREGGISVVIRNGVFNGACSTMVRASKVPISGYNELLPVASDWCYWVDTLANGGGVNYLPEVLGRYRRHANNVTFVRDGIGQNSLDHLNTCNYVISMYPEHAADAFYCYAKNIRSLRKKLPYLTSVFFAVKVTGDVRSIFALVLFVFTLGRFRL